MVLIQRHPRAAHTLCADPAADILTLTFSFNRLGIQGIKFWKRKYLVSRLPALPHDHHGRPCARPTGDELGEPGQRSQAGSGR